MPMRAAPEINPAQMGSQPSTQISCLGEPATALRPIHQNTKAPIHMASVDSGGSTTPSPIDTADSGKRPRERIRSTSKTNATMAAIAMATMAEAGRLPNPLAMRSATPFHWTAAGMANCSVTSVAVERTPAALGGRNSK